MFRRWWPLSSPSSSSGNVPGTTDGSKSEENINNNKAHDDAASPIDLRAKGERDGLEKSPTLQESSKKAYTAADVPDKFEVQMDLDDDGDMF